jgi:flagellar biosynthesis/type III secretory pathway protein FliH
MSSFDAFVPTPAPAAGETGAGFVPLRPPGAGESATGEWRPLFARTEEAVGAEMSGLSGIGPADAETDRAAGAAASTGSDSDVLAAEYERGRRDARADVEAAAESLVRSLEALAAFRAGLGQRYERELLALAVEVAAKVVRSELRERPDAWLDMIRDGVRQAVDREQVRVRVPAVLAGFLRERMPALQARLEDVKELEIIEDPSLDADGCVVETRFGELDLGVGAQIEQVRRGLAEA